MTANVPSNESAALAEHADTDRGQYFLNSPNKLARLMEAAGVRESDNVVEIGAGAGTVGRMIPQCNSLTLVEIDERLASILRHSVPDATVICGDGLSLLGELSFDVLFSNMTRPPTQSLVRLLPALRFRVALLAVGEETDLTPLAGSFDVEEVTTATGADFTPAQPIVTNFVKVTPLGTK